MASLLFWPGISRALALTALCQGIGAALFFIVRRSWLAYQQEWLSRAALARNLAIDISGLLLGMAATALTYAAGQRKPQIETTGFGVTTGKAAAAILPNTKLLTNGDDAWWKKLMDWLTGKGDSQQETDPYAGLSPQERRALQKEQMMEEQLQPRIIPSKIIQPFNPALTGKALQAGVTYQSVAGVLAYAGDGDFYHGSDNPASIHPSDVTQGHIGDCYLLATLAGMAQQDPSMISRMIHDNKNGTYSVAFYNKDLFGNYKPVEVIVDAKEFPLTQYGNKPYYAGYGDSDPDGRKEIWPMVIEKVWAQFRGSYPATIGARGPTNLAGGAMQALTGIDSTVYWDPSRVSLETLAKYFEQDRIITVSTFYKSNLDVTLKAWHEYYVTDVDVQYNKITLRNPHGWDKGEITFTLEEFLQYFSKISVGGSVDSSEVGTGLSVRGRLVQAANTVSDATRAVGNAIGDSIINTVEQAVRSVVSKVEQAVNPVVNSVANTVQHAVSSAVNAVSNVVKTVSNTAASIQRTISSTVSNAAKTLSKGITKLFKR